MLLSNAYDFRKKSAENMTNNIRIMVGEYGTMIDHLIVDNKSKFELTVFCNDDR